MAWTKCLWTEEQYKFNPDPNWSQTVIDKINEMTAQGKTDGIPTVTAPPNNQVEVVRVWVSLAAAQEWQDFITPYNPVWFQIFEGSPSGS